MVCNTNWWKPSEPLYIDSNYLGSQQSLSFSSVLLYIVQVDNGQWLLCCVWSILHPVRLLLVESHAVNSATAENNHWWLHLSQLVAQQNLHTACLVWPFPQMHAQRSLLGDGWFNCQLILSSFCHQTNISAKLSVLDAPWWREWITR